MSKKLYIVGKTLDYKISSWEFIGVFDNENDANLACINEKYFYGETELNKSSGDATVEWEVYHYPRIEEINNKLDKSP